MGRASTILIALINLMFMLSGIIIICKTLYRYASAESYCEKIMNSPLIILGLIVIGVSLLGLIGSMFKDSNLLMLYLVFIGIIIGVLMIFTIFIFLVTNKGKGKAVSGLGFQEYRLEDFSQTLQKRVSNQRTWNNIKTCFIDAHVCKSLVNNSESDSFKMKLSPIQSGCCKPPISCEISYKNGSSWRRPVFSKAMKDTDCTTWKNEERSLCFDCNSCKAGFLAIFRHKCRVLALCNILVSAFLMLVYSIGCCARRSIKYRYVKYSPYIRA